MANSFGDTVSDLDYARQRWQSWQAQAKRLEAELAAARAQIAAMHAVLVQIQHWDCLNPPVTHIPCVRDASDFPWLKRLVEDALAALSSAEDANAT